MSNKKTHWRVEDDLNYLGSYSFQPDEIKTLTIKEVKREKVKSQQGSENKNVIYFVENEKPMICNQVNSKTLSNLLGSEYIEDWNGKPFMIRVENVKAFGETVKALRVIPKAPTVKKVLDSSCANWSKALESVEKGETAIESILKKYTVPEKDIAILKSVEVKKDA